METKARDLTAYCGRYCGTCGVCRASIEGRVAAIEAVVQASGVKGAAEGLGWPLMRDLATRCCAHFEGEVESFADLAPRLFPTHCRDGCVPPVEIAACCKGRGHATCADCPDLAACDRMADLAKRYPEAMANLRAIAADGLDKWALRQQKAAKAERKRRLLAAVEKAVG